MDKSLPAGSRLASILLRTSVSREGSGSRATNSGQIAMGSVEAVVAASTSSRTRSAFSISAQARATPICSTASGVSRRPAVSMTCSGMPSI